MLIAHILQYRALIFFKGLIKELRVSSFSTQANGIRTLYFLPCSFRFINILIFFSSVFISERIAILLFYRFCYHSWIIYKHYENIDVLYKMDKGLWVTLLRAICKICKPTEKCSVLRKEYRRKNFKTWRNHKKDILKVTYLWSHRFLYEGRIPRKSLLTSLQKNSCI